LEPVSRVLLGVTGSVAAVKTPELYRLLRQAGHEVKVAATRWSLTFFDPEELEPAPPDLEPLRVRDQSTLYLDEDEWPHGRLFEVGEPVLHIELRRWADTLLIAPLDANTLAKVAHGFCDNLLTCVYRAWDFERPVILAPAMNTMMWENPVTARHLRQLLEDRGGRVEAGLSAGDLVTAINETCPHLRVIGPVSKRLACGDEGVGGMSDLPSIVATLSESS
jgi:phosphopantothenoylcysteine decarboxylase